MARCYFEAEESDCATDKKSRSKSLAHISLLFKGRIIKSPICSYIDGYIGAYTVLVTHTWAHAKHYK